MLKGRSRRVAAITPSACGGALPTFIIGGAMKAGTTSLWAWVSEHPEIGMASGKEPGFFTRERGVNTGGAPDAPSDAGRYDKGVDWYASLFAHCRDKAIRGEASTRYLHAPDAADLIHRDLPNVRLIFTLRDPARRIYAHYRHELRYWTDLPDFESLVLQEHPRLGRYLADSSYGTALARYFARFKRDRILVLFTDELERHPEATASRIFGFVGADAKFMPASLTQVHNPSACTVSPRLHEWLTRRPHAAWRRRLPEPLADWATRAKRALVEFNKRPEHYVAMSDSARERLIAALDDEITSTERILGCDLSEWRRV